MSYSNPTKLRLGMAGEINGRRHTVIGRVVLGMQADGETYYWNEFNLSDGSGKMTTLVFEETDDGSDWKLFVSFDPVQPLSAAEAAEYKVGDSVQLAGAPARIKLVSASRVYFVEGGAPEGVEVGDLANYFNAEASSRMQVVSWTGDEIEFFQQKSISGARLAEIFGLPKPSAALSRFYGVAQNFSSLFSDSGAQAAGFIAICLALFAFNSCEMDETSAAPPPKIAASSVAMEQGSTGELDGHAFTVTGHAVIEVADTSKKFDRHEFELIRNDGSAALLLEGVAGNPKHWFSLLRTPATFTPMIAAGFKRENSLTYDGQVFHVRGLFLCRALSLQGQIVDAPPIGVIEYGFVAQSQREWLLVRWTESGIRFYRGNELRDEEASRAMGSAMTR